MLRGPHRRAIRTLALALAATLLTTACVDDGPGRPDELGDDLGEPTPGVLPTIDGGVELATTDPAALLVGTDLLFGTPLPSEQEAAEAFTGDPEIAAVVVRRVYDRPSGRRLGDLRLFTLDGSQLFDEDALAAFESALVGTLAGGDASQAEQGGRPMSRATGERGVAIAFREGDVLSVATGAVDADVTTIATRQIAAVARGEVGSLDPVTPLPPLPIEAAFVPVPTVTFAAIPPPEVEPLQPEVPTLAGATAVQGRYGVVAGERRTVVWAFSLDPATYPSAEALVPALPGLVASRAEGAPPQASEVIDRVVLSVDNPPGEPSARVFRHQGLVLLVEGTRPDQLDAVVTAWITALGPT